MENSKQPAFPIIEDMEVRSSISLGLTKREYFAGLALQGILANRELQLAHYKDVPIDRNNYPNIHHGNCLAIHAIAAADELLKQLEA